MARSSSSDDDDGERKQRRDANEATSGNAFDDTRLTPDGIRVLRNEVEQTSEDLLLQVLSVHRCTHLFGGISTRRIRIELCFMATTCSCVLLSVPLYTKYRSGRSSAKAVARWRRFLQRPGARCV